MTDQAIIQLYLDRDETAITVTDESYGRYLTAIANHILQNRNDSEESVNDTYLAAWNTIPPHIPTVLSTFLGKITRRIAIDRYRHRHRDKRIHTEYALSLSEWDDTLCDSQTPETALDAQALSEAIEEFVRGLSTTDRRLFLGRYFYFDPLQTVAAYCGLSESNAKTKLYRLRARLKIHLEQEGFYI